ncbi:MAG TPA: hypothetical protein PK076_01765 [Saprospiraceae bacterium]|nr:hypothetical protein [Saprospiraceae bacterium]HQW54818.1 hypothetical protein [Saprospiraceae bacterium]
MKKLHFLYLASFFLYMSCANNESKPATDDVSLPQTSVTSQDTATGHSTGAPPSAGGNNEIDMANMPKNSDDNQGMPIADFYRGANGEVLLVRYFKQNDKPTVGLTFTTDTKEIFLDMISGTEFAKGADYGNAKIKWVARGENGILVKDGKSVNFHIE